MSIASVLVRGRRQAEARMTSRCTVRRKTGGTTTNGEGLEVPAWSTVHSDLPVRLVGARGGVSPSRTETLGDVTAVQSARREAHFPYATSGLVDGDLVEITSGDSDGLVLRIIEADWQDQATARRVPVEATRRPAEWDA